MNLCFYRLVYDPCLNLLHADYENERGKKWEWTLKYQNVKRYIAQTGTEVDILFIIYDVKLYQALIELPNFISGFSPPGQSILSRTTSIRSFKLMIVAVQAAVRILTHLRITTKQSLCALLIPKTFSWKSVDSSFGKIWKDDAFMVIWWWSTTVSFICKVWV